MSNAMEELMRLHPAVHYGRREHRPSDVEVFESGRAGICAHARNANLTVANRPWDFRFSLPLP